MDRPLSFGSVPEPLDEGPEDGEGVVDVPDAALLLGRGVGGQLDEGCGGGEHGRGSSPMRDHAEGRDYPGMYRRERATWNPGPTPSGSVTRSQAVGFGIGRTGVAGSHTQFYRLVSRRTTHHFRRPSTRTLRRSGGAGPPSGRSCRRSTYGD